MTTQTPSQPPLRCVWCEEVVDLPQKGWRPGFDAYCQAHWEIAGRHPWTLGQVALMKAEAMERVADEDLIRWPFGTLHGLTGVLAPGRVTYVAAFPGNGKTAFVTNCIASWMRQKKSISYLALESDPGEVMARMACFRAGIDPDEALSYRLREAAQAGNPLAEQQLSDLADCYRILHEDNDFLHQLRIEPIDVLSPQRFTRAVKAAQAMESDIMIVDHVDHSEADQGDHSPEIQVSNTIQQMALSAAKQLNIHVLLTTQLNSSRAGGDPLAHYRPPATDWLYNKSKKEMIGAIILGLHRVLDPNVDQNLLRRIKARDDEPWRAAVPHRMGVSGMKLRFGGGRKDRGVALEFRNGVLRDAPVDIFGDTILRRDTVTPSSMTNDSLSWMDN